MTLSVRTMIVAAALALGVHSSYAQVPSKVTPPVAACKDLGTQIDVAALADTAAKGAWGSLSTELASLRADLDAAGCLSSSDERLIVVFPGKDGLGERMLYSIVFPSDEAFASVLPGLSGIDADVPQLFEVFLSDRPRSSLSSNYVATKQDDPSVAQAISALSSNTSTLLTLAGTITGAPVKIVALDSVASIAAAKKPTVAGAQPMAMPPPPAAPAAPAAPPPPHKSFVSVARVDLSTPRSKVEVARKASIPPTRDEIVDSIKKMIADIRLREARDSAAALAYASFVETNAENELKKCEAAQLMSADPVDCRPFLANLAAAQFATVPQNDREAVADTNKRIRNFIADLASTKIEQKASLTNEPKKRTNISALTGFIALASSRQRVKADGGRIVGDPLPRVLTAVGADIAFRAYQPSIPDTAKGPGAFIGATLTPNLGIAAAFTWRIVNGLSLNLGGAVLAVPTGVLDAPAPTGGKPFATAGMGVAFGGLVFNIR